MRAVDTNVVVRFLTGDHPVQSMRAKAIIESEDVYVCTTVMLESEWVLRSSYGFTPVRVAAALRAFAGLPHVRLEDPDLTALALERAEGGMDFADALHLAKAAGCEAFLSFDRRLARSAEHSGGVAIQTL